MPIKEHIWDIRSQWKDIGRKLGLKDGDIRAIHEHSDGECLHEVLSLWIHTGQATISDLLTTLESRIIRRPDIARNIREEQQGEWGLSDHYDGGTSKPLEGLPTIEELCALPVEKAWYRLGLWLGIEEKELTCIKHSGASDKVEAMFKMFLRTTHNATLKRISLSGLPKKKKDIVKKFFCQLYPQQLKTYQSLMDMLSRVEKMIVEELFDQIKLQRKKLVLALVKTGLKKTAEKVCLSRGLLITIAHTCTINH